MIKQQAAVGVLLLYILICLISLLINAGIAVVHQEIKLAEPLTVAENMFLGNVMMKGKIVDWAGMRARAQAIVDDLGMDIDINAQVSSLSVAKKQIVEIILVKRYQSIELIHLFL